MTAANFALVRFTGDHGAGVGALVDDRVIDVTDVVPAGIPGLDRLLGDDWEATLDAVTSAIEEDPTRALGGSIRMLAPLRPVNLYCAFANYRDHLAEMGGDVDQVRSEDPLVFQVPTTAVVGPTEDIVLGRDAGNVDWEGELAAVIGKVTRHVTSAEALEAIAGYSVINDVSVRGDGVFRGPLRIPDFVTMKGQETFKPMGPGITPARCIANPGDLTLTTIVNGVVKQDSSTAQLIFSTAELISYLSRLVPLHPGDVISTGTPAGVGAPRGEFLHPGDLVEVRIEEVGALHNSVVAAQRPKKTS